MSGNNGFQCFEQLCYFKEDKLYENILNVKDTIYVNNIEGLDENDVIIEGYSETDEYMVVDINCSEIIFGEHSGVLYGYIADRNVEVVAISEIHENGGQVGSEIAVQKRLLDLSSVPLIAPNFDMDGGDQVYHPSVLVGANIQVLKGEAIFINSVGDITDVEGCVVSILLKIS